MDELSGKLDPESLPLKVAYRFLTEKGLSNEANGIRLSPDKFKSYTSTLRRSKVAHLLQENGYFEEFINQCWPNGKTEKGKSKIKGYVKIYDDFINNMGEPADGDSEEEDIEDSQFAFEEHLRDYLGSNLSTMESGLKLAKDDEGKEAVEYPIDAQKRRIDILAIDRNNVPVVIELKVSRGYQKVIGQCLYYRTMIKRLKNVPKVRIIIVAHEISPELKMATEELEFVDLYEYKIAFKVEKVK